jgi:hypothetical protein
LIQVSAATAIARSDDGMHNHSPTDRRVEDAPLLELDLRGLPSPEPMMRALAAADALQPGQALQVLTPLLPTPLLDVLQARGLQVTAALLPGGGARVLIRCPLDDDEAAA